MLARYLRQGPARYAAEDTLGNLRLAMALRNFLQFNTRGDDLPHMATLAHMRRQIPHPAFLHVLGDVFNRHDPRAVGVATDMIAEGSGLQGQQPHPDPGVMNPLVADENHPLHTLFSHLHHYLQQMQNPALHAALMAGYGQLHQLGSVFGQPEDDEATAERKYNLGQAVRETVDPHEMRLYDLLRWVGGTPMFDRLRQGRTQALGGVPAAIPHLYDTLHLIQHGRAGNDPGVIDEGHRLRHSLAESIRQVLLPTIQGGQ